MGSPIHLSKTVMNLVSNAAEAMPEGGSIKIKTINISIFQLTEMLMWKKEII
jgi:signal transduction histidine kinase